MEKVQYSLVMEVFWALFQELTGPRRGGDWSKRNGLIPKNGKSKDLLRLTST